MSNLPIALCTLAPAPEVPTPPAGDDEQDVLVDTRGSRAPNWGKSVPAPFGLPFACAPKPIAMDCLRDTSVPPEVGKGLTKVCQSLRVRAGANISDVALREQPIAVAPISACVQALRGRSIPASTPQSEAGQAPDGDRSCLRRGWSLAAIGHMLLMGVYLAKAAQTSMGHHASGGRACWHKTMLGPMSCVALAEVVNLLHTNALCFLRVRWAKGAVWKRGTRDASSVTSRPTKRPVNYTELLELQTTTTVWLFHGSPVRIYGRVWLTTFGGLGLPDQSCGGTGIILFIVVYFGGISPVEDGFDDPLGWWKTTLNRGSATGILVLK
ncbi:hypothetical protein B0H14DRAFT_2638309 [Mycena olivaceomarginata]|nr:hypothetical protein B0H14DRAFT_2638309 [Mycena olivaceomarginata]